MSTVLALGSVARRPACYVLTENVDFAALVLSSAEDLVAADPGADSLTNAQRLQIQGHYDNPAFPHGAHTWTVLGNSAKRPTPGSLSTFTWLPPQETA